MNTGAEPGKLILSWEFLGILGIFWKRIATDIVTTWKDRNCLILLYITFGGLSLASEAATGKN